MTAAQHDVLLALNLRAMRWADYSEVAETGVYTIEVANTARRPCRSTAKVLSDCRDRGLVRSLHGSDRIGWELTAAGVAALERDRGSV